MTDELFSQSLKKTVEAAIEQAELNTSGEIRVHIEKHCSEDVLDRAAKIFAKLGMHKTNLRNGVLFYLASVDHKFAVLGDVGINQKVPDNFWDEIKEEMQNYFKMHDFEGGLSKGILKAGEQLKKYFPYESADKNELPNEISY
ncbi:MAG: TPM domain-containing protein [Candidatus Caenarcaniphilales bacterium]|nr:TPM domain-containing protein [Candidatus Caenarcaniphilales bacterium]